MLLCGLFALLPGQLLMRFGRRRWQPQPLDFYKSAGVNGEGVQAAQAPLHWTPQPAPLRGRACVERVERGSASPDTCPAVGGGVLQSPGRGGTELRWCVRGAGLALEHRPGAPLAGNCSGVAGELMNHHGVSGRIWPRAHLPQDGFVKPGPAAVRGER